MVGDDVQPVPQGGSKVGEEVKGRWHAEKVDPVRPGRYEAVKINRSGDTTMEAKPANKQILVVDDDVGVLRLMRETLTSFLDCRVDTSPSAEYAFELALRKSYGLFIFDFSMPVVDGALLYNLLTKVYGITVDPPRTPPPLILMSGNGEQARARALLREPGVRGLLPKPFTIDRLLSHVEAFLPGIGPTEGRRRSL